MIQDQPSGSAALTEIAFPAPTHKFSPNLNWLRIAYDKPESFGQIIAVFQSDWKSLPVWKIVVLVAICAVIVYVLYKAVTVLWEAAVVVFGAFVALLSAFVSVLPYIVAAGLIAFAGGWVIHNVNF